MRSILALAPLVLTTACLASKSDFQSLQTDVRTMRVEQAQADSLNRVLIDRVSQQLRAATDSLTALGDRVARQRSENQASFSGMQQQLLAIQALTGQSEQRLQEVRASLEERSQQIAVARGDTSAASGAAGPNQIFQIGRDQLLKGSNTSAREAFQDLLVKFPTSSLAADAEFYIGESYAAEGNGAAADSAYARVAAKYPRAPRAATALYKRAVAAQTEGRARAADQLFQELIRRYPASDEAALARERARAR
ncbi:MAG: tetratricopeptide repeat protein [Gemmatimonadaceae bacterium]|nr:tetratricopeptide repeat protein [Gemmatimonadaceae bacterium]